MRVSVTDPQTGKLTTLPVIGVLSDSVPGGMTGIWTSQATLTPLFGNRVVPTTYLLKLNPGVDPTTTAKTLQNVFMANSLQADSGDQRRRGPRPGRCPQRHQLVRCDVRAGSGITLSLAVPWLMLSVIFLSVYLVALATTLIPARYAARIYPAEALRYQ